MTVGFGSKFLHSSRQSLGNWTKHSTLVPSSPLVWLAVVSVEALLFRQRARAHHQQGGARWRHVMPGTMGGLALLLLVVSHMCAPSVAVITASPCALLR